MAVGIITSEITMIQPKNTFRVEIAKQTFFYLLLSKVWIALRRKQTFAGGHQCALAVTLNATTFKNEVEMGLIGAAQ